MTPSAINPISVAFNPRCLHIYDNGARCRLPARYAELAFCPRHISLPEHQYAQIDFNPILLAELQNLSSAISINAFVSSIVLLLAQGRLSPRQASTYGYLANLLLASVRGMYAQSTQNPCTSIDYQPPSLATQDVAAEAALLDGESL